MSAIATPIISGLVGSIGNMLGGKLAKGKQDASNLSVEMYNYDFVGLFAKIIIFFGLAWIFEIYIKASIAARNVNPLNLFGIAGMIAGFIYDKFVSDPPQNSIADNEIILKLFSPEGYNGFRYWDIVKGIGLLMVSFEAYNYYSSQEKAGGSSSPMTLGVFGLIIAFLGLNTVPSIIEKLKMYNLIPNNGFGV